MSADILHVDKKMNELMKTLLDAPLLSRDNLKDIPLNGLYVFYENDKPIYVGISGKNRMKKRIMGHGRKSGGHNSATFAFNIAKKEAEKNGLNTKEKRYKLEKIFEFANLYTLAKERVSKMKVRVIEINDPYCRAFFEIYAALVLNTTEYNSFETH
jgi:hypothetical protein